MLVRVLQFVIGLALAGGGGWLGWTHRASFGGLMPPGQAGLPLYLLAAIFGVTAGIVFLVSAVHPRPNQRRARAEKTAREDAALEKAEAYYSERNRAADRDWRSADITPLPEPAPAPIVEPLPKPVPPPQPEPVAAAPVLQPAPPPKPEAPPVFPAGATLAPIPRAPQPPPVAPKAAPPSAPVSTVAGLSHPAIRAALASGNLAEAGKLLDAARDTAKGMDLAELTALAGDHAQASGETSHARWLWKVALKRFAELDALGTPTAVAVASSLKPAG
jgi:hypothetical protein